MDEWSRPVADPLPATAKFKLNSNLTYPHIRRKKHLTPDPIRRKNVEETGLATSDDTTAGS